MLLSERELELSDEHTGIIELDPDAKIGSPAAAALGLDDAVIEVAVTPNRPDCLGVRGIARDLAAAGLGKLKKDAVKPVKGGFANPIPIELEFDKESADACPVFAGRLVRGVKNGPSPDWLQRRLKAIGLRPINALVDITNYIAYDRGRPLHVYDADKLKGAIRARLGRKGETVPRARRQDLRGRRRHVRHRRRSRRARARRGDRRRGDRRHRGHHQRLHRVGLFRSEAHGAHRAEARHPVRRAVPVRARRRSRFRRAGARACHRAGARALRRRRRARSRSPASRRSPTSRSNSISAWSSA